ncbi:MAG TPA: hypothetical protein VFK81_13480 [Terriglobales bacterium]|nr:hypothetical protein [Terriglobales bacterium]
MRRNTQMPLLAGLGLLLSLTLPAFPQGGVFGDARGLVSRVQEDLRLADGLLQRTHKQKERYDKEKERLDNAQRHLSELDRELAKNNFDKGKLDAAIDDVKNVAEHNTLSPETRDALATDLRDLREMRATRGALP